ncbi:MAG: STAS domain-containing protein [Spirochaetota bacterium]
MKIQEIKNDNEKISFSIEGDLSIYSVKELKNKLESYFENMKNIEFDLSAVDKVDTAGFQLLEMLKKELAGKDKTFSIINPSNEIIRIFNLYGEAL